jgi:glycerol-3-phosphate dehydrogenase
VTVTGGDAMAAAREGTKSDAIPATAREATLDRLERERFDCVVIGGGIAGAGVAREASLRGLSVALLEAEDFASGTSSRSSKLIHGGLRYLAMGDVGLVRTTALERKQIARLAPHLAVRRWMVVPARSYAGHLKNRAGIMTYEKLGAVEGEDLHRSWSREDLEREEPLIDRSTYKHACVYREYLTDDAHLVLANLRSAVGLGAAVLNHAGVDAIVREGGVASGVEAACRFTGRRFRVRARCVINAAGPWVDAIRRLEDGAARPLLHLSKGIHVVVPAERLPVRNMLILRAGNRRSIFVIRQGPVTYMGTTDTTYDPGYEVWPEITREDVDYVLAPTHRDLTVDPIGRGEIVGAWAGLRPLIAEPGKPPQEISRRDEVLVGPASVVTVAGGKLTGYRPMARETLERAARVGSLDLAPRPASEPPLPGGDFDGALAPLEEALVREAGVTPACAARIVRLYGTEARELACDGAEPLVDGAPVLAAEVEWAVRVEGAARLEDAVYRRLRTAHYVPEAREAAVEPIADRMAGLLGWTEEHRRQEVAEVRARLAADLAFSG